MLPVREIDRQLLESCRFIRRLSAIRDGLRHAAVCPADNHLACPKFQRLMDIAAKQAAKAGTFAGAALRRWSILDPRIRPCCAGPFAAR